MILKKKVAEAQEKSISQKKFKNNSDLPVDKVGKCEFNIINSIFKTVEAEITAMMPLQRTCVAESRVRNKLSNGPLRAQSNVVFTKYSATLQADVICRGYVGILLSARVLP